MASPMLPWATYRPFASEHHCEGDFVLAKATIWAVKDYSVTIFHILHWHISIAVKNRVIIFPVL